MSGTPPWTALPRALLERLLLIDRTGASNPAADLAVETAENGFGDAVEGTDLEAVAASAELTDLEVRVLALCVAVDADRGLQRMLGALQHDAGAIRPEVDLLERLLGPDAVDALADAARLVTAGLLELDDRAPFAAAAVLVPRRVAWAVRGDLSLDPGLPLGTELMLVEPTSIGAHDMVVVHGDDRVRRHQCATRALARLAFLLTTPPTTDDGWRTLVRNATVGGLGVVLDLPAGGPDALTRSWLERADHLAFALCAANPIPVAALPRRPLVELAAEPPATTSAEWDAVFPGAADPARRPSAEHLHLAGRVRRLVRGVPDDGVLGRVATGTLLSHATRVVPRARWDDLVLPDAQSRQLQALLDRYRQRSTVHGDWGLPLYPSPGVVALFSGPSGTGKTTSAEVLAHELGVDMFRVDLSALVSKYIGETEKNLEQIFSAAHTGDYLLLFDEADSLFGSRSKVTESKDRYANLEVSYLLQRLETYDGFVVLTSNFQGNIDSAFLRRIHATVHFTVPSATERELIWKRALGGAPTSDLDLGFVAQQFDLAGGSIRNAALTAAFGAAAAAEPITMPGLLRAVATELTKLGRRPQDAQFGIWLDRVRPSAEE